MLFCNNTVRTGTRDRIPFDAYIRDLPVAPDLTIGDVIPLVPVLRIIGKAGEG